MKQCFSEKKQITEKSLSKRSISQDVFSDSQSSESESVEAVPKRKLKGKYTSIDPQAHQCTEHFVRQVQRSKTQKRESRQNLCKIHFKELDMICEEELCQKAVCSSCILFGNHKSHKYSQIHKFYQNVDTVYNNIQSMELQIKKKRKSTEENHAPRSILPQLRTSKFKMQNVVESFFKKCLKMLMRRKKETLTQMDTFYEETTRKMQKYSQESKDLCGWTDRWCELSKEIAGGLDGAPRKISNCFKFLGKISKKHIFMKGQNIIDNLNELQTMLDNKLTECLQGFELRQIDTKSPRLHVPTWTIIKKEISFKNDLSHKLKMWGQSKDSLELDLPQDIALQMPDFANHSDIFGDSFDPSNTNLMSGLNLLNEKVRNQEFDFSQNESPLISMPLTQRNPNAYNSRGLNLQRSSVSRPMYQHANRLSGSGINSQMPKFMRNSNENTPISKKMMRFCSNDKVPELRVSINNYGKPIHLRFNRLLKGIQITSFIFK